MSAVRNRSREIVELLSDLDKVRAERKKAKSNRGKYTGTGNDGMSFSSGGSRYGGFGSDSLGFGSGDRECRNHCECAVVTACLRSEWWKWWIQRERRI